MRSFAWLPLLCRFLGHTGGNTLMIAAAALIPLTGMVGGAMDMSRLWLTKTRMQHACDAAVLAGRKQMGGGTWGATSNAAANQFFTANFADGAYGSTGLTKSFSESGGKVSGVVGAVLPMTLMKVMGFDSRALTVTCDAEMRLPNTDVMFVLDTTGSMAQKAVNTDPQTKIQGLRSAVKCFYEILAKLPTDAVCAASKPTGGTTGVQIRFGFVPYATNVNVGYLLPTNFVANSWPYQSRTVNSTSSGFGPTIQYDQQFYLGSTNCPAAPASTATRQYSVVKGSAYFIYTSCTYYYQDRVNTVTWRYGQITHDISGLKNGSTWNTSFTLPIGNNGTAKTIDWDGCIEERATVSGTNFTPIPAGAKDLDIDSAPVPGDASTLWAPALPDVIYTRQSNGNSTGGWNRNSVTTTDEYGNGSYYACPRPARKLQAWGDPAVFDDYVDKLTPEGNTYHDIGILWGARLMSPTGIFKSENATTQQGGDIERHMIFMTDGDTATRLNDYGAYGVPWFDKRNVANPGATTDSYNDEINARFAALCTAVKNKNITLWVISFGDGSNSTTESRLQTCATSSSYYFKASSSAALQTAFSSIANQISQLRLTK
ncbi:MULTISPECIES: TadE/TadG family type IV pilus assembly protein [Sphingomonas]|uniref:TadE/TadG family type IV pilus assembly protein n=1 Tax=Sphingomonas TaxID=13687 RepID=UPI0020C04C8B|nr:TadE/TadG family type IV pilus assembly protein [Sphingomonas faeni]MCK8455363.1 Tad domain-containing protein [Sphingomonas faeni]